MFNMSSAMGAQFAEATSQMTERIRSLGPNPLLPLSNRDGRCEPSDALRSKQDTREEVE